MKVTGDDTTMVELPGGKFYNVRGQAMQLGIDDDDACALSCIDDHSLVRLIGLRGKQVLILELVNKD